MLDYDLTRAEQVRRTDLAQKARRMILSHMKVEAEDETSLTLDHRGYYVQLSFSPLHPLLVVCLAKAIRNPDGARKQQLANELNLHSVLGSHAINEDVGSHEDFLRHCGVCPAFERGIRQFFKSVAGIDPDVFAVSELLADSFHRRQYLMLVLRLHRLSAEERDTLHPWL